MKITKLHIQNLPKTSILAIMAAISGYALGRGYIQKDTADLIFSLLVALGIGVNADKLGITKNK